MRLTPERLLRDPETFGLLFESLCIRDLCIYAGKLGGRIFHYRDRSGLEADAVVSLDDGRWAPVEVKLGGAQIDEAAKSLRRLTERVETSSLGEPAFLMALIAAATAYRRGDDGNWVPAAFRPGRGKGPDRSGSGPLSVAGAGFEPTTSGL